MASGTVKFFNEKNGWGFIKPDNSNTDIFVHKKGLVDTVKDNDRVIFDIEEGKKGPQATNVELVNS